MKIIEGTTAQSLHLITPEMVRAFVEMSGDQNPIHNVELSVGSGHSYQKAIVPGLLTASLISALIANELPGPGSIYAAQTLKFVAPVYVGDTVLTEIRVLKFESDKPRVTLDCRLTSDGGRLVIIGEAVVVPPTSHD